MAGVVLALPFPSPAALGGKVDYLSPLHLRFTCGVAGDRNLPPILEAVEQGQGNTEELATLHQALMRGLPSCRQVFRWRAPFSASLQMIALVKNVSLTNPSLDPVCGGGGGGGLLRG